MDGKKPEKAPERWSAHKKTQIVVRLLTGKASYEVSRGARGRRLRRSALQQKVALRR